MDTKLVENELKGLVDKSSFPSLDNHSSKIDQLVKTVYPFKTITDVIKSVSLNNKNISKYSVST